MRRLFPIIIGVLSITAACHNLQNDTAAGELASVVIFTNDSPDEAALYAVVSGTQTRIGTVMSGRTDTLSVPPTIAGSGQTVNFVARPLAKSIRPQTGPISMSPGDWIQVRLPADERLLVVLPARP